MFMLASLQLPHSNISVVVAHNFNLSIDKKLAEPVSKYIVSRNLSLQILGLI